MLNLAVARRLTLQHGLGTGISVFSAHPPERIGARDKAGIIDGTEDIHGI